MRRLTTWQGGGATRTRRRRRAAEGDVLVVFGITGDLARVMTFHSLYRLERRGLLACPIVGVAVDDWTHRAARRARPHIDRRRRARRSTRRSSRRLAARLSYVQGDFADAATYARLAAAIAGARHPVFYLETPPSLFATVAKGLADAGLLGDGRLVVEKPFGHDLASAQALAAELHRYVDESQLFRIDHYLGKMGLEEILYPAVREHDARAGLEPQLRRLRADHDGRGLRRRGARALLRPCRRAPRRRGQPPHAGRSRRSRWRRRRTATPSRSRTCRPRSSGRPSTRTPSSTCAASTTGTARSTGWPTSRPPRRSARCGSRSRTGAGRGCRSSSAPASCCRRPRPRCASSSRAAEARFRAADASSQPDQLVIKLDPSTGVRIVLNAQRADAAKSRVRSSSTWSSRRGRRGADPVRGASPRRAPRRAGRASAVRRRSRRRGGSCSHSSTTLLRCTRTRREPGARRGRRAGRRARRLAGTLALITGPGVHVRPCTGRSSLWPRRPRTVEEWTIAPRSATSSAPVGRRSPPSRRTSPPTAAIGACRACGARRSR